jgi:hypothetical protein
MHIFPNVKRPFEENRSVNGKKALAYCNLASGNSTVGRTILMILSSRIQVWGIEYSRCWHQEKITIVDCNLSNSKSTNL